LVRHTRGTRMNEEVLEKIEQLEKAAQKAAEARLSDCMEGLDDEDYGDSASAPFDGCDKCVVREVLHAAWPWLYSIAELVLVEDV